MANAEISLANAEISQSHIQRVFIVLNYYQNVIVISQTANHSIQPQVENTLTEYIKKYHYQNKSKQA